MDGEMKEEMDGNKGGRSSAKTARSDIVARDRELRSSIMDAMTEAL